MAYVNGSDTATPATLMPMGPSVKLTRKRCPTPPNRDMRLHTILLSRAMHPMTLPSAAIDWNNLEISTTVTPPTRSLPTRSGAGMHLV